MLENLSRSGSICKERKELMFRVQTTLCQSFLSALTKGHLDSKRQLFSLLTDATKPDEIFQHFLFWFQILASAVICFYFDTKYLSSFSAISLFPIINYFDSACNAPKFVSANLFLFTYLYKLYSPFLCLLRGHSHIPFPFLSCFLAPLCRILKCSQPSGLPFLFWQLYMPFPLI